MRFVLYAILLVFNSAFALADTASLVKVDSIIQSDTLTKDTSVVKDTLQAIMAPRATPRHQETELWVFIACCFTFLLAGLNRRINEKKHDQSKLGFMKIGI